MTLSLKPLLEELAIACQEKGILIATAESCTGGGVAYEITTISGSSQWFDRGFVTYSNQAKIDMLGVPEATITRFGAVSQEVAIKMAEGALANSAANFSLSITGVAGPDGGTLEKPVGTCWFAWSSLLSQTVSEQKLFMGDRESIRADAIYFSLAMLLQRIQS